MGRFSRERPKRQPPSGFKVSFPFRLSLYRAKIGKREAQKIASGYVSFPERETNNARKYRSIYTLSFLTHHIQTWGLIETHCDELEYKEGGLRPRECQGEATNINLLLSRKGRQCCEDYREIVRIPITPASKY